jgi:GntR family transcriptional regulator
MPVRDDTTRHAVRARLRALVAEGHPGDRLPSERELAEQLGAARMTVRHAMDALVAEGLLERRHGSGTYLLPRPVVRFLGLTSFSQDMRERGLEPGSRLLGFAEVPADEETALRLRVDPGTPVLRFTRLRTGDGRPMAVETTEIARAVVPGLGPEDLGGSLYELLARRYGIVPASASVTIEAEAPDAATAALLDLPAGGATLRMRMVDADGRGHVVMAADCHYRGDEYRLSASVTDVAVSAPDRRAG